MLSAANKFGFSATASHFFDLSHFPDNYFEETGKFYLDRRKVCLHSIPFLTNSAALESNILQSPSVHFNLAIRKCNPHPDIAFRYLIQLALHL